MLRACFLTGLLSVTMLSFSENGLAADAPVKDSVVKPAVLAVENVKPKTAAVPSPTVTPISASAVPAPSIEEVLSPDALRGKVVFESICIHCHHRSYDISAVGAPGLKSVLERRSVKWIDTWLSAPEAFSKVNVQAKELIEANPYGLIMPAIPEMQEEKNRYDMIEYLKTLK